MSTTLKFNPFTGNFDYTFKLGKEEVTAENLAANSVTEAKVSFLSEIVKTGSPEQTITVRKNFEPPQIAQGSGGTGGTGTRAINVTSGEGGNTTITGVGIGGQGGALILQSGNGGVAEFATTSSTGGAGGTLELKTGLGGIASVTGGAKVKGGAGGVFQFATGRGGEGGEGTESTGGAGGSFLVEAAAGGKTSLPNTTNIGGKGGIVEFKAGAGGAASGASGSNTGGEGGRVEFAAGKAGVGGTPKGGAVVFASGAGTAAAQNGPLEFKTGATLRFKIEPEGEAKFENKVKLKEGLGVFNKAPPASQPAEIKPEEITVKALMEKLNTLHKEYGLTA